MAACRRLDALMAGVPGAAGDLNRRALLARLKRSASKRLAWRVLLAERVVGDSVHAAWQEGRNASRSPARR